ncbi:MAG: phosphotransferase [Synechococcus sp.]|nr:phosphotransferase [Synechococcus sp.]
MHKPLGAQSTAAAARRILGPLARARAVDGSGRPQGFTTLGLGFFVAELPAWLPGSWRQALLRRAQRRWGSLRFVQKQFSVAQEETVLRCLYLACPNPPVPSALPVPLVLGVSPGDGCGRVLLEDVAGIGSRVLETPAQAAGLAEQIVRLEAYLTQAEAKTGQVLPRHQVLVNPRRLRLLIRRTDDPSVKKSELLQRVRVLGRALAQGPTRLSHNDIGPGNMAVQTDPQLGFSIRFIDFGSVSHNVLGADLHHYAAWGLDSTEQQAFYERLSDRYAALLNQPLPLVRAGAYAYALERSLMRWWRRRERQRLTMRARAYLRRIEALLVRSEAELGRVPQG